ncbi:MAG: DUF1266 domain-containing protein [Lachnospirales bacterium]
MIKNVLNLDENVNELFLSKDIQSALCFGALQLCDENDKSFLLYNTKNIYILLDEHKIKNEKSAKNILGWLLEVGFRNQKDNTKSINISSTLKCLIPLGLKKEKILSCNTIIGYDIELTAYLARLAYNARFITERECMSYFKECFKLANTYFYDWNEYFVSVCIGFSVFESMEKAYAMSTQASEYLQLEVSRWKEYSLESKEINELKSLKDNFNENLGEMTKLAIIEQKDVEDILTKVVGKSLEVVDIKYLDKVKFEKIRFANKNINLSKEELPKNNNDKTRLIDFKKLEEEYTDDFKKYIEIIKPLVKNANIIGTIVDDFDPFTFEHRYLIEKALEEVDFLFLFIKDNEEGLIPLEHRFKLLQLELNGLRNITILTCGGFVF